MAGLADPSCMLSRVAESVANQRQPWVSDKLNVNGKEQTVNWAGGISHDNRLASLKVRVEGSPYIASAGEQRNGVAGIEITSPDGTKFRMQNGSVYSLGCDTPDTQVPKPGDFRDGAAAMNALLQSPALQDELKKAGVTSDLRKVVSDRKDIMAKLKPGASFG